MKKAVIGFVAMAVLLFAGATSAFAAGSRWGQNLDCEVQGAVCSYAGSGCHHGDLDGDGICDLAGTTCFYGHRNILFSAAASRTSMNGASDDSVAVPETTAANDSEEADMTAEAADNTTAYNNTPAYNGAACPSIGCDGICVNNGAPCVDADGNGICDHYDARMQQAYAGQQQTNSYGGHHGRHHGGGHHGRCW